MRAVLIAATLAIISVPAYAAADLHVTALPTDPGVIPPNASMAVLPIAPGMIPNPRALEQALTAVRCQVRVQKAEQEGSVRFKRLDELPWGLVEHAVLRSVGGCPVREVVYQGQTYWVQPAAPATIQRVEPLTGHRVTRQK